MRRYEANPLREAVFALVGDVTALRLQPPFPLLVRPLLGKTEHWSSSIITPLRSYRAALVVPSGEAAFNSSLSPNPAYAMPS